MRQLAVKRKGKGPYSLPEVLNEVFLSVQNIPQKRMRFFPLEGPVSRGDGRSELALKHLAMFPPALSCTTRQLSLSCALGDGKEVRTVRHVAETPIPTHSK